MKQLFASMKPSQRETLAAYIFLLPVLLGLLILVIGPIIASFILSFTEWNFVNDPKWIGLDNYTKMFTEDPNFEKSLRVTLTYTLMSVPIYTISGLALSLLLNLKLKGMYLFRTIFFLPSVISAVAVSVLWIGLLNPDFGAVNTLLREIGITDPPRWLGSRTWAIPAMVLVGLWGVGGSAIIYLAGLQNIPEHLYEAAAIDGAGSFRRFRSITLPLITPTLFFTLITGLIGAFQVFDTAFILGGGSRGGRGGALLFYLLYLWNEGFRNSRFGYASALSWVLVIIAGISIVILFKTSNRWVYSEIEG